MALSGSITTAEYEGRSVTLNWSATQDIVNNRSAISWSLVGSGSYSSWVRVSELRVTMNGKELFYRPSSVHTNCYSGTVLASGSFNFGHNTDGSSPTMSFTIEAGIYVWAINRSASGSWTLDTIPRASTPSLSSGNIILGNSATISISRASNAFTHKLTYSFGNRNGTIGEGIATSKSWTIPLAFADQIPNATSGWGTITCYTYNGGTLIGSKSVTFTVTVPSNVVPSCSLSLSDKKGYLSKFGGYVQGQSILGVNVSASGIYGSSIKSYSTMANGSTYNGSSFQTDVLNTAGENTIQTTVKDSRGRSASASSKITVLAYSPPRISKFTVHRCDEDGTINQSGSFCLVTYSHDITPLSDKNSKAVTLKYKKTSESDFTSVSLPAVYSAADATYVFPADDGSSYDVRLSASDYFTSSGEKSARLSTAYTLVHYNSSGKGISFGKISEKDCMESAMDIEVVKSESEVPRVGAANGIGSVELRVHPDGYHGLYSATLGKWLLGAIASGEVYMPGLSDSANKARAIQDYNDLSKQIKISWNRDWASVDEATGACVFNYNNIIPLKFADLRTKIGAAPAFVVSRDQNNGYIRFPGIKLQIAWKRWAFDTAIANAWGSIYESPSASSGGNWAAAFANTPATAVFVNEAATDVWPTIGTSASATAVGAYYLKKGAALTTSHHYTLSAIAIGQYS